LDSVAEISGVPAYNPFMQPIHDRMPVVLATEDWDTWLDTMPSADEALLPLLKPFAPDLMQIWAVSNAVGRVTNQGEELIRPVWLNRLHGGLNP
jgi:putative SOS response-associated peptidase YedK